MGLDFLIHRACRLGTPASGDMKQLYQSTLMGQTIVVKYVVSCKSTNRLTAQKKIHILVADKLLVGRVCLAFFAMSTRQLPILLKLPIAQPH